MSKKAYILSLDVFNLSGEVYYNARIGTLCIWLKHNYINWFKKKWKMSDILDNSDAEKVISTFVYKFGSYIALSKVGGDLFVNSRKSYEFPNVYCRNTPS